MLPVSEAEAIISNLVHPLNSEQDTEIVDLLTADGRILAKPAISQLDFPHWDNSAMDGYAVRYEDVQQANAEKSAVLQIIEEIPAGYQPQATIQKGQAARIFTGAVMPNGADTIVIQENTNRENNQVSILVTPKPQEFVRKRASFYQAGSELLPQGIKLNAPEIAVLAAAQCNQFSVYRKARVAILSTGDELAKVNEPLQPGQIVDSNQYALATLVRQAGAEALMLGIVKDEPEILKQTITQALSNADIVISSGGVSVGEYDYVEKILDSLGGKIHIRAVKMKPGKPLTVASFPPTPHSPLPTPHSKLYFGLPGNPVSALVTFWRFVLPAIKKLSGIKSGWEPTFIKAKTSYELRSDGKRESFVWGKLSVVDSVHQFDLAGGTQASGNLINLAQTNALAVLPVGTTLITQGNEVEVLKVD
ncbi:MAG: molybdopterin molybdotransferase MoeA [Scytonematopsis contorta HA4267-MV1]|jgi:molybdopterin molybdotransferase|nr:molybdopterin molybdotransferase MoeA [Scytonematopsis contorta HA4267-MV1]